MEDLSEIVEAPLSPQALGERYRALCNDARFENLPGKIELDIWGRILMSPASNQHGVLQARLVRCLAGLHGEVLVEASVATKVGLLVADVAWLSAEAIPSSGIETPLLRAPALCIEIASPSNSRRELDEKVAAYLDAGAVEAWIVFRRGQRIQRFGARGELTSYQYNIDLAALFSNQPTEPGEREQAGGDADGARRGGE